MAAKMNPVNRAPRKAVKRATTKLSSVDGACVAFVFALARSWVREGLGGDEPGTARSAYDLLLQHNVKVR